MRNNKTNNIKRSPASDCLKTLPFLAKKLKKVIIKGFSSKKCGGGWVVGGGKQLKKNCVYQYAIASSRAVLSQSWQAEMFYHNPDMFFFILKIFKRLRGTSRRRSGPTE